MTEAPLRFHGVPLVFDIPATHPWWAPNQPAAPTLDADDMQRRMEEAWRACMAVPAPEARVYFVAPWAHEVYSRAIRWEEQTEKRGYYVRRWNRKTPHHRRLNWRGRA